MLSAYCIRYCNATWTEKKEGERKSRSRRAWDILDGEKRVRRCCGQRAESGDLELNNTVLLCTMFLLTSHDGHVSNCLHIMLWPLLALLYVPLCLAAQKSPHDQLVELAAAGNGIIRLNERTFDLLTSPNRDWSASIQLTALNPQRRCAPCKWVSSRPCPVLELNHSQGI